MDAYGIAARGPDLSHHRTVTARSGPCSRPSPATAPARCCSTRSRTSPGPSACRRLWLITTNDNLDALRFYQRRGLRLAALRPGAVDESRAALKPSIAEVGEYGIPIRDEIVLEKAL